MSSFARISCGAVSSRSATRTLSIVSSARRAPGLVSTAVYSAVQIAQVLDERPSERPVAGSHLRHQEGAGFTQPAVQVDDRAGEQLGEHRMDVGAGDEVAVGSDGRLFEEASVTEQRELHVLGERDRAVVPDRARDGVARIHELQRTGS